MRAAERPTTPWRHGRLDALPLRPRLEFGRMYEDPAVEHAHLPPEGRVVAVASAGDVAIALARTGRLVTAVDCNPAQLAYLERRLRGAAAEPGTAERLLGLARAALRPVGWHPALLDAFCQLDDPGAQVRLWRARLATPALRRLADAALRPGLLRLAYGPAFARVAAPARSRHTEAGRPGGPAPGFGATVLDRLEAGFARHPNRRNPWAGLLLRGRWSPAAAAGAGVPLDGQEAGGVPCGRVELRAGDLAAVLEAARPRSYHGFAISNVLDGPDAAYRARLLAAVRRAAAPGAVLVLRTLAGAARPEEQELARDDRSLIWGGIAVLHAEEARWDPPTA